MFYSRGISKKNVWPRKADTWLQLPVVAKPGRPTPKPLVSSSCIKKKGIPYANQPRSGPNPSVARPNCVYNTSPSKIKRKNRYVKRSHGDGDSDGDDNDNDSGSGSGSGGIGKSPPCSATQQTSHAHAMLNKDQNSPPAAAARRSGHEKEKHTTKRDPRRRRISC
jgi:hypothetical protein